MAGCKMPIKTTDANKLEETEEIPWDVKLVDRIRARQNANEQKKHLENCGENAEEQPNAETSEKTECENYYSKSLSTPVKPENDPKPLIHDFKKCAICIGYQNFFNSLNRNPVPSAQLEPDTEEDSTDDENPDWKMGLHQRLCLIFE